MFLAGVAFPPSGLANSAKDTLSFLYADTTSSFNSSSLNSGPTILAGSSLLRGSGPFEFPCPTNIDKDAASYPTDSPGGPGGPGGPRSPGGPLLPSSPCGPLGPGGPISPTPPMLPSRPTEPLAPGPPASPTVNFTTKKTRLSGQCSEWGNADLFKIESGLEGLVKHLTGWDHSQNIIGGGSLNKGIVESELHISGPICIC